MTSRSGTLVGAWAHAAQTVWPPRLLAGVLGATALLALALTARSLSWPMAHDAPLMYYAAWLVRQGVIPYREIFDMNFPGTYLLHLLALTLFGGSDLGFRLFDLSTLAVTTIGLGVAGRSLGPWAGIAAPAIFWLYHVAGGAWQAGQRDFLLAPFLAWGVALTLRHLAGKGDHLLFWAGLCLGFAIWIKPYAFLLVVAILGVLVGPRNRGGLRSATVILGGVVVASAGILGWLVWTGGFGAFFDLARGYLVPLYSPLGKSMMGQMLRWHAYGRFLWASFGMLIAVALWHSFRARSLDRRHLVLALGVLYGVVHFFGQGKGWEYHLVPLGLFAALLGSSALDGIVTHGRRAVQACAIGGLVLLASGLGLKGVGALDAPWYNAKRQRALEVTEALGPYLRPRDTVQVMDTTEGGIHALFLLGVRQPTRFLYDFHFYHDAAHPTIQALRREFVERLRHRPPAFVVLFQETWLRPGYDRVREWPALDEWLERAYRLDSEGAGYRIYAKRADS